LVLEMVSKLPLELRMMALGLNASPSPAPVAKRVYKRGTEPHRAWADARRDELRASLRRVRSRETRH